MTSTADLSDLLGRVEKATGADRELDAHLWCVGSPGYQVFEAKYDGWMMRDPAKPGSGRKPPYYTASVDDALALCVRLGWCIYRLDATIPGRFAPTLTKPSANPNDGMDYSMAVHSDLRLALLAALLKALIASNVDTLGGGNRAAGDGSSRGFVAPTDGQHSAGKEG